MTHPLTEKMIEEMSYLVEMSPWYEKYPDDYEHDCRVVGMRAVADWQLDRCTEELNGILSLFQLAGKIDEAGRAGLLNVFKKAMRPQQQEDNQ